jgi:TP53 regulating kinase-like protein
MEYIDAITVRDYLRQSPDDVEQHRILAQHIGKLLAKMHQADVIHGDLTTSNIMLRHHTEIQTPSLVRSGSVRAHTSNVRALNGD